MQFSVIENSMEFSLHVFWSVVRFICHVRSSPDTGLGPACFILTRHVTADAERCTDWFLYSSFLVFMSTHGAL